MYMPPVSASTVLAKLTHRPVRRQHEAQRQRDEREKSDERQRMPGEHIDRPILGNRLLASATT